MEHPMQGKKRLMAGLSEEGFALVAELLANDAIDLDAIVAYVRRTENASPARAEDTP